MRKKCAEAITAGLTERGQAVCRFCPAIAQQNYVTKLFSYAASHRIHLIDFLELSPFNLNQIPRWPRPHLEPSLRRLSSIRRWNGCASLHLSSSLLSNWSSPHANPNAFLGHAVPRPRRPHREDPSLHSRRQIPRHTARLPDRLRGLHPLLRGARLAPPAGVPDNRRSLHRRPRELPSLGHHHSPVDLDHQGSPGGRV